jgi:hypothetical protein
MDCEGPQGPVSSQPPARWGKTARRSRRRPTEARARGTRTNAEKAALPILGYLLRQSTPRAFPQTLKLSEEVEVVEEEAVKPGSKKRKVCSSVQNLCSSAHAPVRPCARAVPSMLALWTHVCRRHGALEGGISTGGRVPPMRGGCGEFRTSCCQPCMPLCRCEGRLMKCGVGVALRHAWLAARCAENKLGLPVCEMILLRSPGAPRPTYCHLGVRIATRRYKLIRAKTLAKALEPIRI